MATSPVIRCDNQAALKAFQPKLRCPDHQRGRLFKWQTRAKEGGRHRYELVLQQMVGYRSIEGNELTDREAQRAT